MRTQRLVSPMFLEQRVDNLVLNGVYFFQLLFFQSPIDERTCAQEPKVMKNIVAGNWKSNKLMNEALELMAGLNSGLPALLHTDVLIAPPSPYLSRLAQVESNMKLAAQTCSASSMGAHTGEHTAAMLTSIGVHAVLVGHSERREAYGESNEVVQAKVSQAIESGMQVILCCGEPLEHRESGSHYEWVESQLRHALNSVAQATMNQVVIAYEPIWAIGTGKTASSDQAQEMHAFIRNLLADLYNQHTATHCQILYGGSCKPSNALEIFSQPDVNGGLIGGAALDATSFLAIVAASETAAKA